MSSGNIPKSVLRSPGLNEGNKEDKSIQAIRNAARFHLVLRTNGAEAVNDMHQNRMKNLRKELDYLKETEWNYDPIDKYIGQTF